MRVSRIFSAAVFLTLLWGGTRAGAVVIKIATLSPDGSAWMEMMRSGGNEVARKTNGAVKFKFYPGGVMGDDQTVLRKIHLAVWPMRFRTTRCIACRLFSIHLIRSLMFEAKWTRSLSKGC